MLFQTLPPPPPPPLDIAVGAPYENGGTVYIYHGKDGSSDNVIIDTTEQQVEPHRAAMVLYIHMY